MENSRSFERLMRETFPDVSRERIIRRHVAAAAIFTFYISHTPGIHADERKETFSITGRLPQHARR